MIEFKQVSKCFGERDVLRDIDLTISTHSIHYVIGTSGVGKSVLLKMPVGLVQPDRGAVFFEGINISHLRELEYYPIRRKCGMVLQQATLLDTWSVQENVILPLLQVKQFPKKQAEERAKHWLDQVGMPVSSWKEMPSNLGPGIKKRIAIARALALEPTHLIYDEPTTSLDPIAARKIDELILRMAEVHHLTSIVISHDLASILEIAQQITLLHEQKLHCTLSKKELLSTEDPVLRAFLLRE